MAMIRELDIRSFRGIPEQFNLDFSGNNRKAGSIVLLGANGSGKSSIVEAIEFCLRGKVSRRGNAGAKIRYEAQNLLTNHAPSVEMLFSDNRRFLRGIRPSGFSGVRLGREDIISGFALAPVVLRRADIEVFWQVSAHDRMRFFFDYMRETAKHSGYDALEIERFEVNLKSAWIDVLEAQITLAGVSRHPVADIPVHDRAAFYEWRNYFYPQYGPHTSYPFGSKDRVRGRAIAQIPRPVRSAIAALSRQLEDVHKLRKRVEGLRERIGVYDGPPPVIATELPTLLDEISNQVSVDFTAIAKLPHVQNIWIKPTNSGYDLDVICELSTGNIVEPTQILSEGALDLLALLILLGVSRACSERGQHRFLVLDDIWQSIDSNHRSDILDYIFSHRFSGWQLLITTHDRLWARLIEERARKHSFALKSVELVDWTPQNGPRVRYGALRTSSQLSRLMDDAPPEVLCSYTGRALEELTDKLSTSMRTAVPRAPGDRYTLEDIWPSVFNKLKKSPPNSAVKEAVEKVNASYNLRNIYGAHYNGWAESLSDSEAREFAKFVYELWETTHCPICGVIVSRLPKGSAMDIGWECGHPGLNVTP
jgi:energy-coupling factor transporter ATP-binding protein EcfA2